MASWSRVYTALVEDPRLISSTHMRQLADRCNSSSRGSDPPDLPVRCASMVLKADFTIPRCVSARQLSSQPACSSRKAGGFLLVRVSGQSCAELLLQQKDVLWDLRPESRLHSTVSRHCCVLGRGRKEKDEGLREEVLKHWCRGANSPEGPKRVGGIHSRHRAFCLGTTVQCAVPEVWEKASHPVTQVGKERTWGNK